MEHFEKPLNFRREKILGSKHPDTATSYCDLAAPKRAIWDIMARAKEDYEEALPTLVGVLSADQPETLIVKEELGRLERQAPL